MSHKIHPVQGVDLQSKKNTEFVDSRQLNPSIQSLSSRHSADSFFVQIVKQKLNKVLLKKKSTTFINSTIKSLLVNHGLGFVYFLNHNTVLKNNSSFFVLPTLKKEVFSLSSNYETLKDNIDVPFSVKEVLYSISEIGNDSDSEGSFDEDKVFLEEGDAKQEAWKIKIDNGFSLRGESHKNKIIKSHKRKKKTLSYYFSQHIIDQLLQLQQYGIDRIEEAKDNRGYADLDKILALDVLHKNMIKQREMFDECKQQGNWINRFDESLEQRFPMDWNSRCVIDNLKMMFRHQSCHLIDDNLKQNKIHYLKEDLILRLTQTLIKECFYDVLFEYLPENVSVLSEWQWGVLILNILFDIYFNQNKDLAYLADLQWQ